MHFLVLDDDRTARRTLKRIIKGMPDTEVREAASVDEARALIEQFEFDVALIDVRLSEDAANRDGLLFLGELRVSSSAVPIIVTGASEMGEIRAAMRAGAHAYILKDELSDEVVFPILENVRTQRRLEHEVMTLRARASSTAVEGLIGSSMHMSRLRETILRVATSTRPVLVTGPTGAGKEVVVRGLHARGSHPEAPFIDLNCGALPANLIESQLFGHERGAFTGADRRQQGCFSAVGVGTLFLDEIGELPLDLQAKLLRVLEAGTFRPLGANTPEQFVGRVVAATHVDLEDRVAKGTFREDLYYRLNVLEIRVPPLAERAEDIPALVSHFAAQQSRRLVFTNEALNDLVRRPWKGNVRELRNLIDRLAVFAPEGPVTTEILAVVTNTRRQRRRNAMAELVTEVLRGPEADKLQTAETLLVEEALRLTSGNKAEAARLLGVHRKVIERRCERLAQQLAADAPESEELA